MPPLCRHHAATTPPLCRHHAATSCATSNVFQTYMFYFYHFIIWGPFQTTFRWVSANSREFLQIPESFSWFIIHVPPLNLSSISREFILVHVPPLKCWEHCWTHYSSLSTIMSSVSSAFVKRSRYRVGIGRSDKPLWTESTEGGFDGGFEVGWWCQQTLTHQTAKCDLPRCGQAWWCDLIQSRETDERLCSPFWSRDPWCHISQSVMGWTCVGGCGLDIEETR